MVPVVAACRYILRKVPRYWGQDDGGMKTGKHAARSWGVASGVSAVGAHPSMVEARAWGVSAFMAGKLKDGLLLQLKATIVGSFQSNPTKPGASLQLRKAVVISFS